MGRGGTRQSFFFFSIHPPLCFIAFGHSTESCRCALWATRKQSLYTGRFSWCVFWRRVFSLCIIKDLMSARVLLVVFYLQVPNFAILLQQIGQKWRIVVVFSFRISVSFWKGFGGLKMITLKCFFWSILSDTFHSLRKKNLTSPSAPEPDQIQALHLTAWGRHLLVSETARFFVADMQVSPYNAWKREVWVTFCWGNAAIHNRNPSSDLERILPLLLLACC